MSDPTATTFDPDWRKLKKTRDKAITNIPYANDDQFNERAYSAVITELRRQEAEAGWVLVRREDVHVAVAVMEANPALVHHWQAGDSFARFHSIREETLAATEEQP